MKAFMDKDFLLETETAKKLFHKLLCGTAFYQFTGEYSLLRHLASAQNAHQRCDQMLAECFQLIVDTGQLRIAAVHQHGIIITDSGLPLPYQSQGDC